MVYVILTGIAMLSIFFLSINAAYKRSEQYLQTYNEIKKFVFIGKEKYDVINLGSTHALFGMDYSELKGYKCLNMALKSKSIYYDLQIVKQYIQRLNKGGKLIFPVDLFSCALYHYSYDAANMKYYYFLNKKYIYKYSWIKKIVRINFPVLNPKKILMLSKTKINHSIYRTEEDFEQDATTRISNWKRQFDIADLGICDVDIKIQKIFDLNIELLNQVAYYCKKHDVKLVFTILPCTYYLSSKISDKFFKTYVLDNLNKVDNGNIQILNYFYDSNLSPLQYYKTADILNKNGALKFTKTIMKDLGYDIKCEFTPQREWCLQNGVIIPSLGIGSGVVYKYYRNRKKFFVSYTRNIKWTLINRKLHEQIKNDFRIQNIIKFAIEKGLVLIDTGRRYSYAEKKIGNVIRNYDRRILFIQSKVSDMDVDQYGSVEKSVNKSLSLLNTDYLDCLLLHYPSGDWIKIYSEMEKLYEAGIVRSIGVCNFDMDDFTLLENNCRIMPMVCQCECNPVYNRKNIIQYCRIHGIQIMAYSPLRNINRSDKAVTVLKSLADKYKKTPHQIVIRWHNQNGVIPIFNTTNLKHLYNNLDIFDFTIGSADMELIDSLNIDFAGLPQKGIDDPNYIFNY